MFLYKEGLCLLINRFSFSSVENFVFSLVGTLNLSKKWQISTKCQVTAKGIALVINFLFWQCWDCHIPSNS